jgi:peroxiredoxin
MGNTANRAILRRAVLTLALALALLATPAARAQVQVGEMAPEIEATFPDGRTVSLRSLQGHVVLVYFWATWCVPCVADIPNLRQLHADYQGRSFEILGVTTDAPDVVAGFAQEHPMPWPNYFDGRYTSWDLWGIQGLPVKFFIDREGRIASRSEGRVVPEDLRAKLDALLGAPADGE